MTPQLLTRRALLASSLAAGAAACVTFPPVAASATHTQFRNGLHATSFSERAFDQGVVFRASGRSARTMTELQTLLASQYGSTEIFARAGTARSSSFGARYVSHTAGMIHRARFARDMRTPFNPELLLCAYYGDMGGQPEPDFSAFSQITLSKPWAELTIEEMCGAMRIYGELAAREILDTGVEVNIWDIGNEVEFGIAGVAIPPMAPDIGGPNWTYKPPNAVDPEIGRMNLGRFFRMAPAEQAAWGKAHLWNYVGKILAATAEGIKRADPAARFATHTSAIASLMPEVFVGFYEALEENGFVSECLGVSYYPTNTALVPDRFNRFKQTASAAKQRFNKQVYIAELGYAAGPVTYGGQNWANPVDGYPISNDGQARFLRDLVEWGVRENVLCGVRPWAPDYVGGSWQGMALWEAPVNGVSLARPGLSAIREGLARAR